MTAIKNALATLEGAVTGIGPAVTGLNRSLAQGRSFLVVESGTELATGVLTFGNYVSKFFVNITSIFQIFMDTIPSVITVVGYVMELPPMKIGVNVIGDVTSVFQLAKESLSLHRQNRFTLLFNKKAWTEDNTKTALATTIAHFDNPVFQERLPLRLRKIITGKKAQLVKLSTQVNAGNQTALAKADRVFQHWAGRNVYAYLVKIASMSDVELERALPDWLNADLAIQGGQNYIKGLLQGVEKGEKAAGDEAKKLIETIHVYAIEKQRLHIIRIIGALVGVISCALSILALLASLGIAVACPPIAIVYALMALSILLAIGAYVYSSSVVENRNGGCSLKLCIPEAVRNAPTTLGAALSKCAAKCAAKINAKINVKRPKSHPFFDKSVQLHHQSIATSYSDERLARRARLAARGVFLAA
ncbi:MAG TPA: hypothetical protein VHK67_05435 [Rhabdochlamydiaceae bacterium]|nr:hypothetical protein [Rhabdochlamydiaceae bacterium]